MLFASLYWGQWWDPVLGLLGVFCPVGLLIVICCVTDDGG
jgi:hypothetical protein